MYVPGENYPLPGGEKQYVLGTSGRRRVLDADEFEFYLSFLDDSSESVSLPVKAAIGVVLQADLKRLYGPEYPYNEINLINEWASFYKGLSGMAKDIARSEVYAFERYLSNDPSTIPQHLSYYNLTPSQYEVFKKLMDSDRRSFETYLAQERSRLERKQYIDRDLFLQKQNYNINKMKREMSSNDYALNQRLRSFMRENIVDYLAGSFFRSPLAQRMNELKSELEYKVREKILGMVSNGSMLAVDGIALYDRYLGIIDKSKTLEEFESYERGLITAPITHPLLRFL